MVTVVRLGRVLGAVWCSKHPVVVPQPKQSNQSWWRENMPRNLPEGSQVYSHLPQNCVLGPEPIWLYTALTYHPFLNNIALLYWKEILHLKWIILPLHWHCACIWLYRCQTEPCEKCEFQGRSHPVGDKWTSDRCQLCYCLSNLTVQCAPFCPYAVSGCPQVMRNVFSVIRFWVFVHVLFQILLYYTILFNSVGLKVPRQLPRAPHSKWSWEVLTLVQIRYQRQNDWIAFNTAMSMHPDAAWGPPDVAY